MNIRHKKYNLFPENILVRDFFDNINDLTRCELDMDVNGFSTVIEYFKKHKEFKGVKLAVVCDSPGKLVFPMLGEHRYSEMQIKPFSSVEAAVSWIIIG